MHAYYKSSLPTAELPKLRKEYRLGTIGEKSLVESEDTLEILVAHVLQG